MYVNNKVLFNHRNPNDTNSEYKIRSFNSVFDKIAFEQLTCYPRPLKRIKKKDDHLSFCNCGPPFPLPPLPQFLLLSRYMYVLYCNNDIYSLSKSIHHFYSIIHFMHCHLGKYTVQCQKAGGSSTADCM